MDTIICLY